MEDLEANSESTQPETLKTQGNETSAEPGTRKPGRPTRNPIAILKKFWDWMFNNR
ncbi:hypothetical protein [Nostoc sp.]|uniref:hypothetical protein n=1 Tax=Nostoc sp. TaxID=1180 RepID=UPI002FF72172